MSQKEKNHPQIVLDLFDFISDKLEKHGISQQVSNQVSIEVIENLIEYWGGSQIYIPLSCNFNRNIRDKQIFKEFNGKNYDELRRKYKLSFSRIREIIKKIKSVETK